MDSSPIPVEWKKLKKHTEFMNWTIPKKIDKLYVILMTLGFAERKQLSKMGAVRITREHALVFAESSRPMSEVWPIMIGITIQGQKDCLGYMLYKDMGNKQYKAALGKCLAETEPKDMNQETTGDLVECILGLGYLYQTHKYTDMEGIMELVVFLEDLLQMKGKIQRRRITSRRRTTTSCTC